MSSVELRFELHQPGQGSLFRPAGHRMFFMRKLANLGINCCSSEEFGFPKVSVELYAGKVATRGLCAQALAESLHYKPQGGLAVLSTSYGALHFITESGAKGCEVVVSGKLQGQRAKSMKFVDSLMIHSRGPYEPCAAQTGCAGHQVKITLPWDPSDKTASKKPLADPVSIMELKDEFLPTTPISEQKGGKPKTSVMS